MVALIAGLGVLPTAAQERAGEALRVQQDATQGGSVQRSVLDTGDPVYRLARIETQEFGSAEMQLDDGSTLTVGPNTDLVIDDFVYSPANGSGRAALSLGFGVLRMISGQVPSGQVRIQADVATIGIRGTTFTLDTRVPNLLRIWMDDGAILVTPVDSGVTFEITAPEYAECTRNFCRQATSPGRPIMFPVRDADPTGTGINQRDVDGGDGGDGSDRGGDDGGGSAGGTSGQ